MKRIVQHKMLLAGDSFEECSDHVHKFFDLTSLVIYDCIEVIEEKSFCGLDSGFFDRINLAEKKNHKIVQELIDELDQAGIQKTTDFNTLEQGYLSKTIHVLSHLLDGFIGIDSFFYNLIDDSHWLPQKTASDIQQNPSHYWLVHIDCFSAIPEEVGLLRF